MRRVDSGRLKNAPDVNAVTVLVELDLGQVGDAVRHLDDGVTQRVIFGDGRAKAELEKGFSQCEKSSEAQRTELDAG